MEGRNVFKSSTVIFFFRCLFSRKKSKKINFVLRRYVASLVCYQRVLPGDLVASDGFTLVAYLSMHATVFLTDYKGFFGQGIIGGHVCKALTIGWESHYNGFVGLANVRRSHGWCCKDRHTGVFRTSVTSTSISYRLVGVTRKRDSRSRCNIMQH